MSRKKKSVSKLVKMPVEKPVELLRLDISYGPVTPEGYTRFVPEGETKWPYKDNSVDEILSAYIFMRIPGKLRGKFMDEAWRVLKPEAKMTIISKYWSSAGAIQDYTFEWPPLVEQSFLYFNKGWREVNKVDYPLVCDFDFVYGHGYDPETQNRGDDTRPFWVKHYTNTVNDLQVVLTKRPLVETKPEEVKK